MKLSELIRKVESLSLTATTALTREDPKAAYDALDELDDLLTDELPNVVWA